MTLVFYKKIWIGVKVMTNKNNKLKIMASIMLNQ